MLKKKICMIGSFSVGKTSLVRNFVDSVFSDKYLTTVGVKIDKRQVSVEGQSVMLMLWDIAGEDAFFDLNPAYLRGATGYFLVVDGTRPESFDKALELKERLEPLLPDIPFILLLNKADLKSEWLIDLGQVEQLKQAGWQVLETSAKTDQGVEQAFTRLTELMI